jgi:hypothetical protein
MIRKLWLIVVLGVLAGGARADAQTYTIKLKEAGPGDTVRVKSTEQGELKIRVVDNNNNELENKTEKKSDVFEYAETIVEKPAGGKAATKLKRAYQTAKRVEDGNQTTLPYQGKTLLIEKKDGKYRFQIEGGEEVAGKDAEELDEEFNKADFKNLGHELFLPKKAVAIDETWKMDAGPILKELEKGEKIELDAAKSVMTGKLIKAYKKGDRQFGVIEFKMEIAINSMTEENMKISVKGSKLVVRGTIDGCIDGSLETGVMKGNLEVDIRGEFAVNCLRFRLSVQGQGTMSETREEVPNK